MEDGGLKMPDARSEENLFSSFVFVIFALLNCCLCQITTAAPLDVSIEDQPSLIAKGHDVDQLDPANEMFDEKLHKMFNEHDMGGNWQVAADYPWMPPLDVGGEGLAVYRNAGRYLLGVHAEPAFLMDAVSGDWIMLFSDNGDLLHDIYKAGVRVRDAVLFVSDMDRDGHLEWMLMGALVTSPGRDKRSTPWRAVEIDYTKTDPNLVQLYVMDDEGYLIPKRGQKWSKQYQLAAEELCRLASSERVSHLNYCEGDDRFDVTYSCLSAIEGTGDHRYIRQVLNRLDGCANHKDFIEEIANALAAAGYPEIKDVLYLQMEYSY